MHAASAADIAPALLVRARSPTPAEVGTVPWLPCLLPADRDAVIADLRVAPVRAGERVCRIGGKARFWLGVVDGMLMATNGDAGGPMTSFTGLGAGSWFGEGTLLRGERWRYDVLALRPGTVAGIGSRLFAELLDRSVAFNRYLMNQLNERLAQFIEAREIDRLADAEIRIARSLAAMFNPVLHPHARHALPITQQQLACLVGLSRQSVNQALGVLQAAQLLRVEYGRIRVLDLDRLRRYPEPHTPRPLCTLP